MTSRERMLTALNRGKPDRLPVQVHSWMQYYLKTYLGGCDQYQAYERFGLDYAIYARPVAEYAEKDLSAWQTSTTQLEKDENGNECWVSSITTPEGILTLKGARNPITSWKTEYLVKSKSDMELFLKYYPVPERFDFTNLFQAKDKLGDKGILRGGMWSYGQVGAWQSFCCLVGTENAIMYAIDEPEWVHYVLQSHVNKQLSAIEKMEGTPTDLIETGGGAGSNTVISPGLHKEFCTPYDRQQHDALHAIGVKVVYHLCGGLMKQLDNVLENGADGLETMTPPSMGGDCDLAEANRLVGDKLFFVGGFDQNDGFERGTPERVRELVFACHAACPDGGYICAPSDHFFHGDPENIQAFADAARECVY